MVLCKFYPALRKIYEKRELFCVSARLIKRNVFYIKEKHNMKKLIALIMTLSTIFGAYGGSIAPKPKVWTAYNLGIDDLNMGIQDFKAYDDSF